MKKGMSQIIAYVLMISLAVALAVFVTIWYRGVAEEQAETILTPAAGAAECEQVNVNINFNYTHCYLMVYNSGKLSIEKLEVNAFPIPAEGNPQTYDAGLLPKQWNRTIPVAVDVQQVEVFPVINVNKQLFRCQKNKMFNPQEDFCATCDCVGA